MLVKQMLIVTEKTLSVKQMEVVTRKHCQSSRCWQSLENKLSVKQMLVVSGKTPSVKQRVEPSDSHTTKSATRTISMWLVSKTEVQELVIMDSRLNRIRMPKDVRS